MLDLAGSLAPIPFYNVQVLSSPHTDDAHRARVAHEVAAVHGLPGLLTLWACQEFFPATERDEGEMTPATRWWLAAGNPFSERIRQVFAPLSFATAVQTLSLVLLALKPPDNERDLSYLPGERKPWSRTDAETVRAFAQVFFPQHPGMQEPTCALYMRTYDHGDTNVGLEYDDLKIYPVHAAPMHAFGHDICAMHYLLRAHASDVVGWDYLNADQIKALERTLPDWDMYEEMGMTPEESYHVAKQRLHPTVDIVPNVFTLDNPR